MQCGKLWEEEYGVINVKGGNYFRFQNYLFYNNGNILFLRDEYIDQQTHLRPGFVVEGVRLTTD